MHKIQFIDSLSNVKRGLGFSIYNQNNENLVGHGGSCPGYKTQLTIDPKGQKAIIVLINARGLPPQNIQEELKTQ